MIATPGTIDAAAGRELRITRHFPAPPAALFPLWTRPEHLVHWWGPRSFTMPHHRVDARPGGAFRICIRSPEGTDHWMRGTYREVVEPERLVFTFAWEDPDGAPGRETLVTVTFAEREGGTDLTFHQALFTSPEDRDSHLEGWSECLDRLAAHVANA
jgi:uncharacterized protein YndB with AHSA1/START domain